MTLPIWERIKNFFRPTPSPFAPTPTRSLRESLEGEPVQPPEPPQMPKGVDLSALWEEPGENGSLGTIFSGVAALASVIALLVILFK